MVCHRAETVKHVMWSCKVVRDFGAWKGVLLGDKWMAQRTRRYVWDIIKLPCISFSWKWWWHAAFCGVTNMSHFEDVTTFRSQLVVEISVMIGIFNKDVDSLEIIAKVNILALLAYVRKGWLVYSCFASMMYNYCCIIYFSVLKHRMHLLLSSFPFFPVKNLPRVSKIL